MSVNCRDFPGPIPGNSSENPNGRHHVARVLRQAEKGQQVLDVGRFDELQSAVLVERDVSPRQFRFQKNTVMRSPKEHRLPPQVDAFFAVLQDPLYDEFRLIVLRLAGDQKRFLPLGPLGPEVLSVSLGREPDDLVGGGEDRAGAAVVLFERNQRRAGILFREIEDIADRGRAKRIDGLGIVADNGQSATVRAKLFQDFGLQAVGVLVLVHQYTIEQLPDPRPSGRIGKQAVPVDQQVIVVHCDGCLFAVHIGVEQLLEFVAPFVAPRESLLQHLRRVSRGR